MRQYGRIRSWPLAGLLLLPILVSDASAVSISLVPDGSTTIGIGETANVDVFMNLDQSDKDAGGISAVTFKILADFSIVSISGELTGNIYGAGMIINPFPSGNFVALNALGNAFTGDSGFLGSLKLTGVAEGSLDLQADRTARFPLFTTPGSSVNRFDFASDDTLRITVPCSGVCGPGTTSIDFGTTFGAPATEVELTDQLISYGVLFSSPAQGGVIWNGRDNVAAFGFGISTGFLRSGLGDASGIRIDFVDPVTGQPRGASLVSIRAFDGGGDLDTVILTGFDEAGAVVASHAVGPDTFGFPGNVLTVRGDRITHATFEIPSGPSGVFFDNLKFVLVPEPAASVLLGLGIAGLAALRRWRA